MDGSGRTGSPSGDRRHRSPRRLPRSVSEVVCQLNEDIPLDDVAEEPAQCLGMEPIGDASSSFVNRVESEPPTLRAAATARTPLLEPGLESPQSGCIPRPFWAKYALNRAHNSALGPSNGIMASVQPISANGNAKLQRKTTRVLPMGRHFADGKRLIDYVLAFDLDNADEDSLSNEKIEFQFFTLPCETNRDSQRHTQTRMEKRRVFEQNLRILGLELEYTFAKYSRTGFVLIHAPFKVLMKQAELLKIKMPVYQNDVKKQANLMDGALNAFLKRIKFLDFDEKVKDRIEPMDYFCQPFIEQHLECFVNHENPDNFFSRSERSRMVYDLLIRTRYDTNDNGDKYRFGVERLVKNGTYTACYPLHDEISYNKGEEYNPDSCSDRQLLYENWVKSRNVWKYQPLHLIKSYFGTKIGFYFAWLGYYTRFLYGISLIGLFCVIYGIATVGTDLPSQQICANGQHANDTILMCPVCNLYCDFTPLNSSCVYSKLTYVFDNSATIIFAAVMSIWATLFLEGWKRYHAELAYKWNVFDFEAEEEVLRPEFQFRKSHRRINPVTQEPEPYIPILEKILRFSCSGITVLFFLCMVIALVIGVVAYRVIVIHVFFSMENNVFFQSKAFILTSITAACLNLVFILMMNYVYSSLALRLTEWECPRTQTEFDNSYTLKVFLFQFINFYSSLFYIAFIKGKLSGPPEQNVYSNEIKNLNLNFTGADGTYRLFGQRLEECDPAGCMVELVIQLFIIMCGKQFFSAFMEIGYPTIMNLLRRWRLKLPLETQKQRQERIRQANQEQIESQPEGVSLVERDHSLNPVSEQFLFDEYLEMVIQFGFCTLFVCAFPLAPLFALLNNILEIRLDAFKFIVTQRKPMPSPARNIGIWMTILDLLSKLSVLCNAFVIAFTSDFVPRLFHYLTHEQTMDTYLRDSLSFFNASELEIRHSNYRNVTVCRYRDYRLPPCSMGRDEYEQCDDLLSYSHKWWMLLAFRLIFVLLFEHVVLSIKAVFAYVIPDVPAKIMIQLQRERYLARQAVLQRTDTYSNVPTASRTPSTEQPETGEDAEKVAYQGEDAFEDDDSPSFQSARVQPSPALRRIYSNRKKPSLASAASSIVLTQRLPHRTPETVSSTSDLPTTTSTPSSQLGPKSDGAVSLPALSTTSADSFQTAPSIVVEAVDETVKKEAKE